MWTEKWDRAKKWLYDRKTHKPDAPPHKSRVALLSEIVPCVCIKPIVLDEGERKIGEVEPAVCRPDTIAKRFSADLGDLDKVNEILNRHK